MSILTIETVDSDYIGVAFDVFWTLGALAAVLGVRGTGRGPQLGDNAADAGTAVYIVQY